MSTEQGQTVRNSNEHPTRLKTTAEARDRHRTHLVLETSRRELTLQERHEWDLLHDADLAAELEQQLAYRTAVLAETKESLEAWAEQGRKDFARIAELETDVNRLNQMLRDTGYGCGQIDAYVAQCEKVEKLEAENARLRATLSNLRIVVRQMPSHQIAMTVITHVDSALAPQPATEAKP